ncbi:H-2 class I histocompatibility antigen Q9 alpha chain-like [Crotalus adamanteus]|uniref:H-2 class I histocompatibility antigen Q9 alpha chain-like n=1 Tax=Crotalus adamanteus TaxID=8729 RepID=A0AAW1BVS0_CROAD
MGLDWLSPLPPPRRAPLGTGQGRPSRGQSSLPGRPRAWFFPSPKVEVVGKRRLHVTRSFNKPPGCLRTTPPPGSSFLPLAGLGGSLWLLVLGGAGSVLHSLPRIGRQGGWSPGGIGQTSDSLTAQPHEGKERVLDHGGSDPPSFCWRRTLICLNSEISPEQDVDLGIPLPKSFEKLLGLWGGAGRRRPRPLPWETGKDWETILERLGSGTTGASLHSLKNFYSSIWDPSQGQPHFVALGYVDGQVFVHYDSNSRREQPRVSWIKKVEKEDPQYWDTQTQILRNNEDSFRQSLENLRLRYNQSEGLHTWQLMYGCELQADGRKGGSWQYGYEGRTFITFDKDTLTWVAPIPQAQITQRKWDAIPGLNERQKAYLEKECIEWLEKYLSYGKETLLRTEPPVVTMSSKPEDGMETHICRLDGFYPREIEASWTRDREVWLPDTLHGSVAPNADGTFHTTLSIQIDPKERGRYRCHVEHNGLQEPLDVALEEPKSSLGIIIGCVVAGLALLGVIVVGIWFFKRRQDDYKKAATSEEGSNRSSQGESEGAAAAAASAILPDFGRAEKGSSPCGIQAGEAAQSLPGGAWPPLEEPDRLAAPSQVSGLVGAESGGEGGREAEGRVGDGSSGTGQSPPGPLAGGQVLLPLRGALRGLPSPSPAPLPPGPDNPPAFPSPPHFCPSPQEAECLEGDFLTELSLSFPRLSRGLSLDVCLATMTTQAYIFVYWLRLTNHLLLIWVVALLITRNASFSACDFRKKGGKLGIPARMALRSAPLLILVLVGVALWKSCRGESLHLVGIHPGNLSVSRLPPKFIPRKGIPSRSSFESAPPLAPLRRDPKARMGLGCLSPSPPQESPSRNGTRGGALQRSVKSTWAPPSAVLSLPQSGGCGKAAFAGTRSVHKLPGCLRTTLRPAPLSCLWRGSVALRGFWCWEEPARFSTRFRILADKEAGALERSGASSHSLKYFSTAISDPSQGLPHFVIMGFVDGQVFVQYDSNSRRMEPRVSWMEKVGKEKPQYWDTNIKLSYSNEEAFRRRLETLRLRYNQSEGFHTLQTMCGCELQADGSKGGIMQHGYDGRTFITFDKETLTWVAPVPQAQTTQRKWDADPAQNQYLKSYLEKECIEWLERYLFYGKEMLLRTEPPEVTMSSKTEMEDGMETHVCRLDGFYPREIEASWTRDGEVWLQDTLRGSVAPNADGTFHTTLSIQIDPKERGRYRCHVEHDGLQEPLDVTLEEPKSNLGIIIGCVVAGLVLLGVIVGIYVFFKKYQNEYRGASSV